MTVTIRRLLLYAIVFAVLFYCYVQIKTVAHTNPSQSYVKFTNQPVRLKVGPGVNTLEKEIILNEPMELDFKTRAEIMDIRKYYVDQYRDLLEGEYVPYGPLFLRIVDNRPWWGIEGEFCHGVGQHSIDGASEETRFFINPFLLLGLDESKVFTFSPDTPCSPTFPRPVTLHWHASDAKAVVTYDISRFFRERGRQPKSWGDYHILSFESFNARDFGYEYIFASPALSQNVTGVDQSHMFHEACPLRSFIHCGRSCGYPGGCNNESPYEPDLRFRITDTPATLYCKLWKNKPDSVDDPADFIFVIQMN